MPSFPAHIDKRLLLKWLREHRLELLFIELLKKNKFNTQHFELPYKHHIQNHLKMTKSLLTLSTTFKKKSIDHVILKGVALNKQLHGSKCVRISKDIDVLIDPNDLLIAHDILLNLGYILQSALNPLILKKCHPLIMTALKDLTYIHSTDRTEIELHWGTTIVHQFGFKLKDTKGLTHNASIQQQTIPVLDNEHNFVYLCIHGASSHWQRIQWLLDLAYFYKKIPLSWSTVIRLAHKYNGTRALLEAQYLLRNHYAFELPFIPSSWKDRIFVNVHMQYTKHIWQTLKPMNAAIAQIFQLCLYPQFFQKYDFIRNRLLFRFPCREKLIKNQRYPLTLLLFIGIFSLTRAPVGLRYAHIF